MTTQINLSPSAQGRPYIRPAGHRRNGRKTKRRLSLKDYNPSTMDELLGILETIFDQEALDAIRDCWRLSELQSLEVFIRKNLVTQNENRSDLYADCGQETPQDVALLAILRLWERLRAG